MRAAETRSSGTFPRFPTPTEQVSTVPHFAEVAEPVAAGRAVGGAVEEKPSAQIVEDFARNRETLGSGAEHRGVVRGEGAQQSVSADGEVVEVEVEGGDRDGLVGHLVAPDHGVEVVLWSGIGGLLVPLK